MRIAFDGMGGRGRTTSAAVFSRYRAARVEADEAVPRSPRGATTSAVWTPPWITAVARPSLDL